MLDTGMPLRAQKSMPRACSAHIGDLDCTDRTVDQIDSSWLWFRAWRVRLSVVGMESEWSLDSNRDGAEPGAWPQGTLLAQSWKLRQVLPCQHG